MTDHISRIPPQALDIERAILGSIIVDAGALDVAAELLTPKSFYATAHKCVFETILSEYSAGRKIDILTLSEAMRKAGMIEQAGGEPYLSELIEAATYSNPEPYCKILNDKRMLRDLIEISRRASSAAFGHDADAKELLDKIGSDIFSLTEHGTRYEFENPAKILPKVFDDIESYQKCAVPGQVRTGFIEIDTKTGGLNAGDLAILAGRPGLGKTTLAMHIAKNYSSRGGGTAFFSMEMSKKQIIQRLICSLAKIESVRVRSGMLSKVELNRMGVEAGPIFELPLYIDDCPHLTVLDVRSKCRRLMRKQNIGLIIIDYLQMMKCAEKKERRDLEISDITRGLKQTAKELQVPILALCQLSRATEQRQGHRPLLSDLRESGGIEQDADIVMFLHYEYTYCLKPELKNVIDLIIGKQRNGPTGTIQLAFFPEYTLFDNLEKHSIPQQEVDNEEAHWQK